MSSILFRAFYKLLYALRIFRPYTSLNPMEYLGRLSGRGRPYDRWYRSPEDVEHFRDSEVLRRVYYRNTAIYFLCNRNSVIEREILSKGLFDKPILELMLDFTRDNSTLIDVGANIGAYAVPLAVLLPDTTVHAFEPNPQVASRMEKNIQINSCSNIVVHKEALSDRQGKATLFSVRPDSSDTFDPGLSSIRAAAVESESTKPVEVHLETLDNVFSDTDEEITFIKIDVQGMELPVLKGAQKTIQTHRPCILFEYEDELFETADEAESVRQELKEFLGMLGYTTYYLNVRFGSAMLAPVNWSAISNCNLLALPESAS